jgi:hypothetical protein
MPILAFVLTVHRLKLILIKKSTNSAVQKYRAFSALLGNQVLCVFLWIYWYCTLLKQIPVPAGADTTSPQSCCWPWWWCVAGGGRRCAGSAPRFSCLVARPPTPAHPSTSRLNRFAIGRGGGWGAPWERGWWASLLLGGERGPTWGDGCSRFAVLMGGGWAGLPSCCG